MKDLIHYIVKGLVENPDSIELDEDERGNFRLCVAEEDRGKVIGRKGRTVHAIRTMLAVSSGGDSAPELEIID